MGAERADDAIQSAESGAGRGPGGAEAGAPSADAPQNGDALALYARGARQLR
jgi:hypothetical protein